MTKTPSLWVRSLVEATFFIGYAFFLDGCCPPMVIFEKKVFCRKVALPVTGSANFSATIDWPVVEYGPMGKVSSLGVFYP